MNPYHATHICLEHIKTDTLAIPQSLPRVTVMPVALDDALWPACKVCARGVSKCECAEYKPDIRQHLFGERS